MVRKRRRLNGKLKAKVPTMDVMLRPLNKAEVGKLSCGNRSLRLNARDTEIGVSLRGYQADFHRPIDVTKVQWEKFSI